MLKNQIDAWWPLVLKRRVDVLAAYEPTAKKHRKALQIDRAALIRKYKPTREFQALAREFSVSTGAVNNALSGLVRIARKLEETAILRSRSDGKRYVIIVPVDTPTQADYVIRLLAAHELKGVTEYMALCDFDRPGCER